MPNPISTLLGMGRASSLMSENSPVDVGAAPSGYGADYDQLFAANPYRNLTYRQTGWQKFLSMLGFRTGYDARVEDAQANAAEYDAGIFSMIQQNQFNDPAAQAQRMRNAGLNPDLQGIGDVAQGASPTEDPNGLTPTTEDVSRVNDVIKGFATTIVSSLTAGMSLYKDITAVNQMKTAIDSQNVTLAGQIMGSIDDYILGSISSDAAKDDASFHDALNDISAPDFSSWGLSPKRASSALDMFSSRLYGLQNDAKARKLLLDRAQNITGLNTEKINPLYDSGFSEQEWDVMQMSIDSLRKTAQDILSVRQTNDLTQENLRSGALQNQGVQQDIDFARLSVLDTTDAGTTQGLTESYSAIFDKVIARNKKEFINKLQVAADHGNDAARCTLYSISLQEMLNFRFDVEGNFDAFSGLSSLARDIFSNKPSSLSEIGRKWSKGLGFSIGIHAGTK